ncbi:MAG: hypothetical protein ACLQSR_01840 [Limisphaerales bacterium]
MFFAVLTLGIAARLIAATLGHDFDFDSWQIVANLVNHEENVYAGTDRYNFAPGWFWILHLLDLLAGHNPVVFRYLVAGFLSMGDAGIFFILWRRFGRLAGCWFFLNPISIIISGFQNNFDNLAILLGLAAVLLMGDDFEQPVKSRKALGLVILGLSLVVKHVFFAFPFWLAVKQRRISQKLIVILIPLLIFALSFIPYWHGGSLEIIQNVFRYRSITHEYFYHMFLPQFAQSMFGSEAMWFFFLILFAFICRRKTTVEYLLVYTCVLVAVAPATLNEYLAIPGAFVAMHLNLPTILYTAAGTAHLLVTPNGPLGSPPFDVKGFGATYLPPVHLSDWFGFSFDDVAIYLLCLSLIWVTWGQTLVGWFKRFLEWCIAEWKNQLEV